MIPISLSTLAEVTQGKVISPDNQASLSVGDLIIDELVIDSRAIDEGANKLTAFLALKGLNFDGHRFAQQVIGKNCQLLIVDHHLKDIKNTAQLVVSDTRIALGEIAAYVKKEVAPKNCRYYRK